MGIALILASSLAMPAAAREACAMPVSIAALSSPDGDDDGGCCDDHGAVRACAACCALLPQEAGDIAPLRRAASTLLFSLEFAPSGRGLDVEPPPPRGRHHT